MTLRPSSMTRDEFVDAFGGVFEHSPWVAEVAFDAGAEDTLDDLHGVMCKAMMAASADQQLALIRAHPDLAGKLAVQGELTAASSAEQQSAGLDKCSPEEFEKITKLNATYVEHFGFPFIMAVKGSSRADIIAAMEGRVGNDPGAEFKTALGQIARIAYLRLQDLFE